jgi:hypothetical protein
MISWSLLGGISYSRGWKTGTSGPLSATLACTLSAMSGTRATASFLPVLNSTKDELANCDRLCTAHESVDFLKVVICSTRSSLLDCTRR